MSQCKESDRCCRGNDTAPSASAQACEGGGEGDGESDDGSRATKSRTLFSISHGLHGLHGLLQASLKKEGECLSRA